jgi:hypothetical protein
MKIRTAASTADGRVTEPAVLLPPADLTER